jgi:trimeric autotransporter adhesin
MLYELGSDLWWLTESSPTAAAVVAVTLSSIAVTPAGPSIANGATQQFVATGTYSDASTAVITTTVTWASSDATKATISNAGGTEGLATSVAAGATTISATLGAVSDSTTLTVTRATIVPTKLASGSSTTDGTSVATASITPTANRVVYAAVTARHTSNASSPEPTLSGCGMTWVKVDTHVQATTQRLHVFRGLSATPSTGALTFDYGAETQTSFCWSVIQCAGVNTSGTNGSGATVQSVTTGGTAATSVTTTLAALENANNVSLVFVALSTQATVTRDANYAELSADNIATNTCTLESEWAVNRVACTPTMSSASVDAIAVEVKAA